MGMRLGGAQGARLGPRRYPYVCVCVYNVRVPLSPAGEHVVGISGAAAGGAGSWVSPERFSA